MIRAAAATAARGRLYHPPNSKDIFALHNCSSIWRSIVWRRRTLPFSSSFASRAGGSAHSSRLPNYYELLGVPKNATAHEIKKAYTKRAKELHPDKNTSKDANTEFFALNEAFKTLSDAEKRRIYDRDRGLSGAAFHHDYASVRYEPYNQEFPKYYQEDPTSSFTKNRSKWEEADYYAHRSRFRSRTSWAYQDEYNYYKRQHEQMSGIPMQVGLQMVEIVAAAIVLMIVVLWLVPIGWSAVFDSRAEREERMNQLALLTASDDDDDDDSISKSDSSSSVPGSTATITSAASLSNVAPSAYLSIANPSASPKQRVMDTLSLTAKKFPGASEEEILRRIDMLTDSQRAAIRHLSFGLFDHFSERRFVDLLQKLPALQHLKLKNCGSNSKSFTGDELKKAVENGQTTLNRVESIALTDQCAEATEIFSALSKLPSLKHLRMNGRAEGVSNLVKLQSLTVTNFEEEEKKKRTESENPEQDDERRWLSSLRTLTNLRTLELSNLSSATLLQDLGSALAQSHAPLSSLAVISNAVQLSPSSSEMKRDASVFANWPSLDRVRSLSLKNVSAISDTEAEQLLRLTPALERLDLSGTGVSDQFLETLSRQPSQKLRVLNLSNCPNITVESTKFIPGLKSVAELRLEGTKVRKAHVVEMKREHPNKNMSVSVTV